ncbi:acyltransferase family protein [Allohahella sp. A8]|uniref:acyltransferase family protein n=1 Tax=Allohahella sp. A8 TaxID=3141461 RepID=UPI003A7FBDAA
MTAYLSEHIGSRDNNFNLIRFVAALLVLISHSFALYYGTADAEPLRDTLGLTLGTLAVDIFFITSGLLVCASLESRKGLSTFALARTLRIYPALIVALVIIVGLVGPLFSTLTITDYFTDFQTAKYFARNSVLFLGVEHQLPGVFTNAPYSGAVNGSLWTLPYEVRMYALLCIVTIFAGWAITKWNASGCALKRVFLSITLLSLAALLINRLGGVPMPSEKFIRLTFMFASGATAFHYRDSIHLSGKYALLAFLALAISTIDLSSFTLFYTVSVTYLTLFLAYIPAGIIRRFNSVGDYSYGLYIYAFTVQQVVIVSLPDISLTVYTMYSGAITLLLAAASWHFVEKPMLRFKSVGGRFRSRLLPQTSS